MKSVMESVARASSVSSTDLPLVVRLCALAAALGAAPAARAQGTRVNAPVVSGGYVGPWQVAANGQRVFYAAWQTTVGTLEVFDVPLDGSQSTRALSAPLAAGRSAYPYDAFRVSPDESHLVYLADQDTDGQLDLYVVATDGSRVSTKLSGPMIAQGDVQFGYQWTPDGTRVLYRADATQDFFTHLYSVRADGSEAPIRLHPTALNVFRITPDSARAVFDSAGQVYSVRVDGSAPAQALSHAPEVDHVDKFALTPDGSHVVFAAGRFIGEDSQDSLFVAPTDGSSPARALLGPVLDANYAGAPVFALTADSTRAVVLSAVTRQLYSVRLDGLAPPEHLNDGAGPNDVRSFRVSPDGGAVVFCTSDGAQRWLCSVPTDHGAAPIVLAGPSPAFQLQAEIGSAGRVVFTLPTAGTYELYSVPLDGSEAPVKLSGPMVAGGNIVGSDFGDLTHFELSPDGRSVVYEADQDTDEVFELYVAPLDGRLPARKLNAPLVAGGDAGSPQFVPGTNRLVYQADQETNDAAELFTSRYEAFFPPPQTGAHAVRGAAGTTPATMTVH